MNTDTPGQIPENVRAASERLQDRGNEDRSKIPALFLEIMKNHAEQLALLAKCHRFDSEGGITQEEWRRLKELRRDFRESLRPGAEKMLRWNNDKGNVS